MSLRVNHRPSSEPVAMSVLLDTNVVSELIRKVPESTVVTWISGHSLDDLYFSSVSEAELRYGAAILPAGRGRDTLFLEIEAMLRDAFDDRVLPFDSDAARAYGYIAAGRRSDGLPDRGDRGVSQHGGGDAQYPRLRRHGNRDCGSLVRGMSGTTEACPHTLPRR